MSRKTQIGVNDRKGPIFRHHRKKTRRNNVDAGKSQSLHKQLLRRPKKFRLLIVTG